MFTGVCLSGGVPGPGGCLVPRGCLVLGGRGAWSGGVPGGGCLVEIPPMATDVGGMHPTGMHSCGFGIFEI